MTDHGYDVADPRDVDPLFGDLATFDALVADAHEHGLRVTVDLIPNHISSQHEWFQAALDSAPGSPERARFHFRPGAAPTACSRPTTGTASSADPPGPRSAVPVAASGTCTCSPPTSRT